MGVFFFVLGSTYGHLLGDPVVFLRSIWVSGTSQQAVGGTVLVIDLHPHTGRLPDWVAGALACHMLMCTFFFFQIAGFVVTTVESWK